MSTHTQNSAEDTAFRHRVDAAKRRLPLPTLLQRMGFECPNEGGTIRSPLRNNDQNPSFSVFQNDEGRWFYKDHATEESGDEITFLERYLECSRAEAISEYEDKAALEPDPMPDVLPAKSHVSPLADWPTWLARMTPDRIHALASERGISPECLTWAREHGLMGASANGDVAFAVKNATNTVVAAHVRGASGWHYTPSGQGSHPLLITPNIEAPENIIAFESQWDALAWIDRCGWHRPGAWPKGDLIVVTRGARNGQMLGDPRFDEVDGCCVIAQNDEAGKSWVKDVATHLRGPVSVGVVPEQYKDLNEWVKAANPSAPDLVAMRQEAPCVNMPEGPDEEAHGEDDASADDPFPVQCLPPVMRDVVNDIVQLTKVPEGLAAVCVLGTVSGAVGRSFYVNSGSGRRAYGNLYLVGVAETGSGKSEAYRLAVGPLEAIESELHQAFENDVLPGLKVEMRQVQMTLDSFEKKMVAAKTSEETNALRQSQQKAEQRKVELEKAMIPPTIIIEDLTSEAFIPLLQASGEQLFSASPDARKVLDVIRGRYNKPGMSDEAIYLKGWSGERISVHRMSRSGIRLNSPRISLLLLVQPDKAKQVFEDANIRESGFFERVLIYNCPFALRLSNREQLESNKPVFARYLKLLRDVLECRARRENELEINRGEGVQEVLFDFHDEVVTKTPAELRRFASRWAEQAWRIAVIIHVGKHGKAAAGYPMSKETVEDAVNVARWFARQQCAYLRTGKSKDDEMKMARIEELLTERGGHIAPRDVQRALFPRGNVALAKNLISKMCATGSLQRVPGVKRELYRKPQAEQ